jgi:uncharacterized damage-inducible protein DinB
MAIKDTILPEFDHEMKVTRRVLERMPMADGAWKPHEKSMSLGRLASHVGDIPGWAGVIVQKPYFEMSEGDYKPVTHTSAEALLADFDQKVALARAAIDSMSDEEMMSSWEFRVKGQVMLKMSKVGVIRSLLMNHLIHHRGQCSVYLRLKSIPVPSIYGPSADESV